MKVHNITTNKTFRAGKVQVYSDFDGTYCPAKHSSLRNEHENMFMKDYCDKMDKFFKDTSGDLHFHITTGRTFGEYEAISRLLKMREFHLPLPESFISKNGSDEFIKNGSDNMFYSEGIFPYKYSEPNKLKENKIKEITNWDGKGLKDFIRDLAKRYYLRFVEADSEHSVRDYGSNSLFSEGKLNPDEWKNLPNNNKKIKEHNIPVADYVLGARKDGNLKINLIFPPDYGYCPERNGIYDNFLNDIKGYLAKNKINFSMDWNVPSKKNHYRNHCNIAPKIEGKALTKLYDTRLALDNAIKNNDLLITAGDGSNDFDMLNPLEYIKSADWDKFKENTKCAYFYEADNHKKLSFIRDAYDGKNNMLKQELESNGLIKQIREMPFCGVIINRDNSSLRELSETFGRFGKIVEVNSGELDNGIKLAIKQYAEKSNPFKEAMSEKFKKSIFGITQKRNYKSLIAVGLALGSAVIAGLIYKHKN